VPKLIAWFSAAASVLAAESTFREITGVAETLEMGRDEARKARKELGSIMKANQWIWIALWVCNSWDEGKIWA
jgi:hypothetical protein